MDWNKARREYISGGVSYKDLAIKYGMSESAITRRAIKEGWREQKQKSAIKQTEKVAESIANKRAAADTLIFNTSIQLLEAIKRSITDLTKEEPLFPRSAKEFAEAIRALQQTMDAKPTELDIEEQKARIEKLRHDYLEKNKDGSVEVILGGGLEEYGN